MMLIDLFKKFWLLLFLLISTSNTTQAANVWQVSIDESNGLPKLVKGGGEAFTSSFIFFDKNHTWAHQESTFKILDSGKYKLKGINATLGVTLDANISKISNQQLVWDISLDSKAGRTETVGGGISFKFDLVNFANTLGEPEILADKSGWAWGKGSQRIEMRFKPAPANVFFERDNKNEIRLYFYQNNIPKGKRQYQATLDRKSVV